MPYTLVAFHAHPDDECLLMGGTIARAAAEGHRVVLVTATDGAAGLTGQQARSGPNEDLGKRRIRELEEAAATLGAARVVPLGYQDGGFELAGINEPARALSRVISAESADVLTGYDPTGGYGHPDHVHLHRVARRAADLFKDVALLEATVDRKLLVPGGYLVKAIPGAPRIDLDRIRQSYLPHDEITHQVDVRRYVHAKIAGLSCHESQHSGGTRLRTVTLLRSLPGPMARMVLGREWFREVGREPGGLIDDVFATCRGA